MIKVDHISKSFDGRVVLDDVSVEFDTGTTNLVIGKSGSGKTVLMKCIDHPLTTQGIARFLKDWESVPKK
mgnify:CR=1 FL=1